MDRLVYTAYSGLRGHMAAQAAIANNIANASTTGFRADKVAFEKLTLVGPTFQGRAPTSEEVIDMILEFDDELVELYKTLANQAQAPPRINALFQNLLEMEEWQKLRNAWATRESDGHFTGRG